MSAIGRSPFGEPVRPVRQADRGPKGVFVLGVYASAVHARWVGPEEKVRFGALAVASQPEIFWRGGGAEEIVSRVSVPRGAVRLVPARPQLNGPSGRALDELFLEPLGLARHNVRLCDLVPHSCMNHRRERVIGERYLPEA